jgi:hypothetical protein
VIGSPLTESPQSRTFIDGYNDRCQPFVWTRPAEEILLYGDWV